MRLHAAAVTSALVLALAVDARAQAYVDEPNSFSASVGYTYAPSGKIIADSSKDTLPGGFESSQPNMIVLAHLMTLGASYVTPVEGLAVEAQVPFMAIKVDSGSFIHQPVAGPYDDGDMHYTLTDIRAGARYQIQQVEEYLGLSVSLAGSVPTDYPVVGLGAPGHGLKALYLGVAAARTLDPYVPNLFFQADYEFALREKVDDDAETEKFGRNFSTANASVGYFLPANFFVSATGSWRKSHGGVGFDTLITEADSVLAAHDRLLKESWINAGGDLGYTVNEKLSVAAAARFFVWGQNTRNQNLFGVSANYRFF